MFSEDIIGRVRDSINIVDLVSGYVALKKTGRNHTGLCPFHSEKTPSFSVNPEKQIFHCFGCGVGGDAFKFLELQEGLNFPEAVRKLADRAGITLPEQNGTRGRDKSSSEERSGLLHIVAEAADYFQKELAGAGGSAARAYLQKRGVSDRTVREFGLGLARNEWDGLLRHLKQKGYPSGQMERAGLVVKRSEAEGHYDRFRNRIIFPIRDIAGKVIAFGGRVMDDGLPKYLNSSETPLYSKSNTLYCLDAAKEQGRKLGYFIIVEGYLDAIACHQYGIRNAVATLGTALTEGHLRLLRRFAGKLILIFDPDPAGVRASLRGFDLFMASGMKVNVVSLPDNDDPDTFLQKRGKEAFDSSIKTSTKLMDFVLSQVVTLRSTAPIDERIDIAKEMAFFIEKNPDKNVQQVYIKKLIDILDIDEAIFRQERFQDTKISSVTEGKQKTVVTPALKRRPAAEEILIHLMLKDEQMARSLREKITQEDFTDPLLKRAAARIFDVLATQGRIETGTLLSGQDEELASLISRYSVLEMDYEDPDRHRDDCVETIKQHHEARRMKTLITAIKQAEARGDTAEMTRLLEQQNSLVRKRGKQQAHSREEAAE